MPRMKQNVATALSGAITASVCYFPGHMRIAPPLLLAAALAAAAACGKSNPPGPPSSGTDSLTDLGYLTGIATRGPYGIVRFYSNTDILVGDLDGYQPTETLRGIVTFNIKAIPQKSTIDAATLQLAQCADSGAPYSLGSILVDQVPVMTAPDSAIYDTLAINAGIATLATDTTLGLKTATVTSSVAGMRAAGDTLIQFRLRFSGADGNNNGISDYAAFSPDSGLATICRPFVTGHRPYLIVSFQ